MSIMFFESLMGLKSFNRLGGDAFIKNTFFVRGLVGILTNKYFSPAALIETIVPGMKPGGIHKWITGTLFEDTAAVDKLYKMWETPRMAEFVGMGDDLGTFKKKLGGNWFTRQFSSTQRAAHRLYTAAAGASPENVAAAEAAAARTREIIKDLPFETANKLAMKLGGETLPQSGWRFAFRSVGKLAGGALAITIPWLAVDIGYGIYKGAEAFGWWDPFKHQLGNPDVTVSYGQQTQRQVMLQHMMDSQMAVGNILGNEANYFHRR